MHCSFHEQREHTDFCIECEIPLCGTCAQPYNGQRYCIHHYATRVHRSEQIRYISLAVLIPLALILTVAFYTSQSNVNQQRARYGTHADEILRLMSILEKDRCNLAAGASAVRLLTDSTTIGEALRVAEIQSDQCPTTLGALITRFFAEQRSLDHRAAVDTAERIVRNFPHRPEGYAYRATAYAAQSRLESAADDYYRALSINPRLLDVPMNLANTLERLGRPCDSAESLEQALSFYPGLENRFEIDLRVQRLRRQGNCVKESLTKSIVEVPFDRTGEVMVVEGEVNGRYPARFIVDTGASSVVITSALADKAGVSRELETTPVYVQTAGGVVDAFSTRLEEIGIGGARVKDLPVLVCETMGNDVDGLLGINFLNRFQIQIDPDSGIILFRDKNGNTVDPIQGLRRPTSESSRSRTGTSDTSP